VHRVVVQRGEVLVAVPEADRLHRGVDHAFRLGSDLRIARLGPPDGPDLPVGAEQATVGGDALDVGLAGGDVGAGAEPADGLARGGGHLRADALTPVAGHDDVRVPAGVEQVLRVAVEPGRVVGVRAVDGDAVGLGPGRLGQRLPPPPVVVVAQLRPVQRAEHDGRGRLADEDQAVGGQRVADRRGGRIPPGAERMPDRGRDVTCKRADLEHGCSPLARLVSSAARCPAGPCLNTPGRLRSPAVRPRRRGGRRGRRTAGVAVCRTRGGGGRAAGPAPRRAGGSSCSRPGPPRPVARR